MIKRRVSHSFWFVLLLSLTLGSCNKGYLYLDEDPSWLGPSIYDYLNEDGHFKNFTKCIELSGYKDILQTTGSKTMFVPNDSAFDVFYATNTLGIKSIDNISKTLATTLVKGYMLNDAMVTENLGYNQNYTLGSLKRYNQLPSSIDSLTIWSPLVGAGYPYWSTFTGRKNMVFGNTFGTTVIYFTQPVMDLIGMSDNDFKFMTGRDHNRNDLFCYDARVTKRDITCKNGYINVIDKVLMPPMPMFQYMRQQPNLTTFTKLLERFSFPSYSSAYTAAYKTLTGKTDSVFTERLYNSFTANAITPSDGYSLVFDPGWPDLCPASNTGWQYRVQVDGGAVFAPTNDALREYYMDGPLKTVYGLVDGEPNWDAIPNGVLASLLNNHFKGSMKASFPAKFPGMLSEIGYPMNMTTSNLIMENTKICSNGILYAINKVCPPPSLASVASAIMFDSKCQVFNWAIANLPDISMPLATYLSTTDANFSLLIVRDAELSGITDQVSLGYTVPYKYKFVFNYPVNKNKVSIVKYNLATGDSIGIITDQTIVKNRLDYVLRSHIIVGDIKSGKKFYASLNGQVVKVLNTAPLQISGGGNMENNLSVSATVEMPELNGTAYVLDAPVQSPLKSPYYVLNNTPEFSRFFSLIQNVPSDQSFFAKGTYAGIDYNSTFLTNFNFTLFVPTNAAIDNAISNGIIKSWEQINAITNQTEKTAETTKLIRFLKNHFMDNSVYVGNQLNATYTTKATKSDGTLNKLTILADGDNILINGTIRTTGKVNILTNEYLFNAKDPAACTLIGSTSQIVIHQIDGVLTVN